MKLDYEFGEEVTNLVIDELREYNGFDNWWGTLSLVYKEVILKEIGLVVGDRLTLIMKEMQDDQA